MRGNVATADVDVDVDVDADAAVPGFDTCVDGTRRA
jgi:hypothetical protein